VAAAAMLGPWRGRAGLSKSLNARCGPPVVVPAPRSTSSDLEVSEVDLRWMMVAIEEAEAAGDRGEIPVGAAVVLEDRLLARAGNGSVYLNDPTAHAEVLALRAASALVSNYRLPGAILYSTVEPCPMCMGAAIHARVSRLVYGCLDPKGGAAGSAVDLANNRHLNHHLNVTGGVLQADCGALLRQFFEARR
jgi:tRNA(adenine34) deaminase